MFKQLNSKELKELLSQDLETIKNSLSEEEREFTQDHPASYFTMCTKHKNEEYQYFFKNNEAKIKSNNVVYEYIDSTAMISIDQFSTIKINPHFTHLPFGREYSINSSGFHIYRNEEKQALVIVHDNENFFYLKKEVSMSDFDKELEKQMIAFEGFKCVALYQACAVICNLFVIEGIESEEESKLKQMIAEAVAEALVDVIV
jgi:hypothetical protein